MRLLKLTFILLAFAQLVHGQEEQPLDSIFYEENCHPPSLVAKAVIHYQQYSKAYLEFDAVVANQKFTFQSLDSEFSDEVNTSSPTILLTGLPYDELFTVSTLDGCGDTVVVATVSTKEDEAEQQGIEVSDSMFKAIVDFQQLDNETSLTDYLEQLTSVSVYEKVAFMQQYLYDGEKFTTDEGSSFPSHIPPPAPPADSCRCKFVFNTTQIATPAILNNGVLGHVHEESVNPGNPSSPKIPWDSDSRYWWFRNTKGAAKWHYAWSEGWSSGSQHRSYSYSVVDSNLVSPHMGQLAYNFLCTNYQEVPRDCECEKRVNLYWRYNSRAVAHAVLTGSSIWDRSSEGRAQDIGVVTLRVGDDPIRVLDAGDVRAESECDSGVNTQWFVEYIDVAASIVKFALAVQDTTGIGQTQIQTLIDDLADDLQTLIQTPIWETEECETVTVDATLAFGDTTGINLPPNTPAYLNVFSFTNQRVGGKRKWFSYAGIESGFYLTGIIPGGRIEGGSEACCTKKIGNWVYGSCESLQNATQNLADQVGAILGLWAPWNLPVDPFSGAIKMPSEYGRTEISTGCDEIRGLIAPPGGSVSIAQSDELPPTSKLPSGNEKGESGVENFQSLKIDTQAGESENFTPEEITIFDLNGRLVYRGSYELNLQNFSTFLTEKGIEKATGLYFVHLVGNGQRKTIKIFVPN
ncbi:MAG: T9SS type A sorting domain-containing protein [Bacteroidetes bacterium]|nr:T9SS type A sorting domain-containing protein [Bacteroidota bacterium]